MKDTLNIRKHGLVILVAVGMFAQGSLSLAQQKHAAAQGAPRVENAKMETRTVAGSLAATLADIQKNSTGVAWVGYAVKGVAGERSVCCGDYGSSGEECGRCELEAERDHWIGGRRDPNENKGTLRLEGNDELLVLFRLQDHHITRIRLASENCALDAEGLPFVWLSKVQPVESVALLAEYVRKDGAGEDHGRSLATKR